MQLTDRIKQEGSLVFKGVSEHNVHQLRRDLAAVNSELPRHQWVSTLQLGDKLIATLMEDGR